MCFSLYSFCLEPLTFTAHFAAMRSGKQNQAYHPICFLSLWRLRLPVELSCGFCKLALGVTQLISWG